MEPLAIFVISFLTLVTCVAAMLSFAAERENLRSDFPEVRDVKRHLWGDEK
jgi:hypothetical protein